MQFNMTAIFGAQCNKFPLILALWDTSHLH